MNQVLMMLYTTVATQEEADKLAEIALSHKLAACVNILSNGQSIYLWEGKIEKNNECYLIFKTDTKYVDALERLIIQHHPYEVPAILKWECKTTDDFYTYVKNSLKKSGFDCQREKNLPDGNTILWYEIYKNDAIELVSYRKEWPEMAKIEIQKLYDTLPRNHIIDIQHVGSTAIPGVMSKPIIDIQIAVDSLAAIKTIAIDALKVLGYVYWDENPDTERMFFVKGMPPFGDKRTHHVHIVEQTSRHWKEKNLFRDYLLTHPDAVETYIHLKKELAEKYTYDREQYTEAKTTFIREILKKADIV